MKEGRIIAGIYAHEKTWWNNSEVFIEEMFVNPARQGKGIGTALLNTVKEYVTKHGLAGMTLSTNKYAPAPKFYEKEYDGIWKQTYIRCHLNQCGF